MPLAAALTAGAAGADEAGRAVYVGDQLLKDYNPRPQLVTPVTRVERPRYPAIDMHCHWAEPVAAEALLAAMDELGVEKAVNLSGGWAGRLERNLARYSAKAPDRLLIFANIDFTRIDEPEFGAKQAEELRAWKSRGVAGLKVFKGLGLTERDASGNLIRIDDPRLDPIWAACGVLKIPVLIHSADPPAFFEPVDRFNERWMQLTRRPNWSFFGPQFPPRDEVLAQRDRVLARHRQTVFIVAHLGEHGDDLATAARWLEAHPNVYTDLSGREAELGRQPYSARRFLMGYSHRVLFGTDRYPGTREQPRHRIYYRLLETQDEYFDYFDHPFPPTGEWKVYGLFLPDDALRRIYRENALRALAGEMPATDTMTTRPAAGPGAP